MASHSDILQATIDRFWETFPPTWNRIRGNVRDIATESFGITVEQFHILRHIRKGVCSVSELAEAKQISRPAISQALDALVEKGLVSRQQSVEDRRFVKLALTANGSELLSGIFRQNREWMRSRMAGLTIAQMEAINTTLEILKTTFDGNTQP